MRPVPLLFAATLMAASAAAAEPLAGLYVCRNQAGVVTGASFVLAEDGGYRTGGAEPSRGSVRVAMGQAVFSGGRYDGRSMLVVNETRLKFSKRVFCALQPLEAEAAPEPVAPRPEPTPKPGPKLIIIKPKS